FFLADQVVADQDVVDAGFRHHFGLADLLAGDALRSGRDLHLSQQRALVGLDMRPVGDAGLVAGHLDARDVALDTVHVDHGAGRAIFTGDFGGEGRCHALLSVRVCRMGRAQRNPSIWSRHYDGYRFAPPILPLYACSISSRSTSSSSQRSSAAASSSCAFAIAAEAASNFLRSLA